jgi:hypothetical protein
MSQYYQLSNQFLTCIMVSVQNCLMAMSQGDDENIDQTDVYLGWQVVIGDDGKLYVENPPISYIPNSLLAQDVSGEELN